MAIEETSRLAALRGTYSDEGMEALTGQLDTLHTYIADGKLAQVSPLSPAQMRGWLEEQLYILRESLREMDQYDVPAGASANPDAV